MGENWSEDHIGDQSGRVALITGANSGIGFEAARALAQHGAHVVLACRNDEKAAEAQEAIDATAPSGGTEVLIIDMGDLDSISEAAAKFAATHERLDMLVNNAGLMATPEQQTAQGFEMQLGVNHLGPVALTAPLLPRLLSTEGSRVVAISSNGHKMGRIDFDDLMGRTKYSAWGAYFQSKLANLLFTRELQRRLAAADATTIAVAAHPGGSRTNLGHESSGGVLGALSIGLRPIIERLVAQSAPMGALPTLRAAVGDDVNGGDYFGPSGFGQMKGHAVPVGQTKRAQSADDARRLWDVSVELTHADYSVLDPSTDH